MAVKSPLSLGLREGQSRCEIRSLADKNPLKTRCRFWSPSATPAAKGIGSTYSGAGDRGPASGVGVESVDMIPSQPHLVSPPVRSISRRHATPPPTAAANGRTAPATAPATPTGAQPVRLAPVSTQTGQVRLEVFPVSAQVFRRLLEHAAVTRTPVASQATTK